MAAHCENVFFLIVFLGELDKLENTYIFSRVYLEYADLAWMGWYKDFINGCFAEHIKSSVGFIASCQGIMALSMLFKGRIFTLGAIGAIIFLVFIIPFGLGSGFPATAIMAVAMYFLIKKNKIFA